MNRTTPHFRSLYKLILTCLIASNAFAEEQTIKVKTSVIDGYNVAVTKDRQLFGVDCEAGELVVANPSGKVPFRGSTVVRKRPAIRLDEVAQSALCDEDQLGSEVTLQIFDNQAIWRDSKQVKVRPVASRAVGRPYRVGASLVAVTDDYQIIGLDCDDLSVVFSNESNRLSVYSKFAGVSLPVSRGENRRQMVLDSGSICSRAGMVPGSDLILSIVDSNQVSIATVEANARMR